MHYTWLKVWCFELVYYMTPILHTMFPMFRILYYV